MERGKFAVFPICCCFYHKKERAYMQLLEQIQDLNFPADLPKTLLAVKQTFDAPQVPDVGAAAKQALKEGGLLARMKPGATVAVGVGSRGIANIPQITKATIEGLREAGLKPYVVPAMGSHGGATAEGQKNHAGRTRRHRSQCRCGNPGDDGGERDRAHSRWPTVVSGSRFGRGRSCLAYQPDQATYGLPQPSGERAV